MNLIKILSAIVLLSGLSLTANAQTKVFTDTGKLENYLNVIHLKKDFNGEILVAQGKNILFQKTIGL